jgi:hypothetical protein
MLAILECEMKNFDNDGGGGLGLPFSWRVLHWVDRTLVGHEVCKSLGVSDVLTDGIDALCDDGLTRHQRKQIIKQYNGQLIVAPAVTIGIHIGVGTAAHSLLATDYGLTVLAGGFLFAMVFLKK